MYIYFMIKQLTLSPCSNIRKLNQSGWLHVIANLKQAWIVDSMPKKKENSLL